MWGRVHIYGTPRVLNNYHTKKKKKSAYYLSLITQLITENAMWIYSPLIYFLPKQLLNLKINYSLVKFLIWHGLPNSNWDSNFVLSFGGGRPIIPCWLLDPKFHITTSKFISLNLHNFVSYDPNLYQSSHDLQNDFIKTKN